MSEVNDAWLFNTTEEHTQWKAIQQRRRRHYYCILQQEQQRITAIDNIEDRYNDQFWNDFVNFDWEDTTPGHKQESHQAEGQEAEGQETEGQEAEGQEVEEQEERRYPARKRVKTAKAAEGSR